jgi:CubicO group peptidase (beta-lactamase class C family)
MKNLVIATIFVCIEVSFCFSLSIPREIKNGAISDKYHQSRPERLRDAKDVEKLVELYRKNQGFNGVVMVSLKGKVVFKKAYGFADVSFNIANTLDTRFRIAS